MRHLRKSRIDIFQRLLSNLIEPEHILLLFFPPELGHVQQSRVQQGWQFLFLCDEVVAQVDEMAILVIG